MEGETQPKLSKRLQIVTLCPLLSGILVCTIIIIAILFSAYLGWIKKTTDYIKTSEYENLEKLSTASSDLIASKLKQMVFEMNMLDEMFNSQIVLVNNGNKFITTENLYNAKNDTKTRTESVWLSDNKEYTDFSKYGQKIINKTAVTDIFMRIVMNNDTDRDIRQIGMILADYPGLDSNEILDYRYPQVDMNDIKQGNFEYNSNNEECKTEGAYSARCTDGYLELKNNDHNVTVYAEENQLKVFLNSKNGAFVYYLPEDYFDYLFEDVEDYQFFFTTIDGKRTIRTFQKGQKTSKTSSVSSQSIAESLFPTDDVLKEETMNIFDKTKDKDFNLTRFSLEGYFSKFYGSLSKMDVFFKSWKTELEAGENGTMSVGSYINEGIVFEEWNKVLDGVIDIIIIQMVMFLILLCITVATVWFLGMLITDKITHPIYLFEQYLRGKLSLQAMDRKYNKEVNQILSYLRLLETLERMIEPSFLNNPKLEIRENNLKEALKLFVEIKNHRGKAIINNLLGNICYLNKDYNQAVKYYKDSLDEMEILANEVSEQEENESKLSEKEKSILKKIAGKDSLNWESEKQFLQESIIDRKQQLCMGLQAELNESAFEMTEKRARLKEIYKYQQEILNYYASSRKHYLRLLKVMIDIAGVFQELKYYHSGIELLDIVHDELRKLDLDSGTQIDIDITRLSRVGVNIKIDEEYKKSLHFDVRNITYEKDILSQMMHYRRGLLLLENEKNDEAAIAFTLAIEKGQYFDPNIRKLAVKSLFNLFEKFGLLKENPELIEMNNSLKAIENSLVIVLAFNLTNNIKLSEDLINFIEVKLKKKWKIGAVTSNLNPRLKMKAFSRDMPDRDLENLILAAKEIEKNESTYDLIINSINCFEDEQDQTRRIMLVIISELNGNGCCTPADLVLIRENKIKLYVLANDDELKSDVKDEMVKEDELTRDKFQEQMMKIGAVVIWFGKKLPFKKALSNVYDSMKNL